MGEYFRMLNLDKRERLDPHTFGCGLKRYEQLWSKIGMSQAIYILLTPKLGQDGIWGRWIGDRIVNWPDEYTQQVVAHLIPESQNEDFSVWDEFEDISQSVAEVMEREFGIKFVGDGWRHIERDPEAKTLESYLDWME